ncbi:MAG: permease of the major facilitator superfamily [Rhodospirillales bacterium]|nr:permease of the major facilitator superfamily [Rhodospirillales bacterium]
MTDRSRLAYAILAAGLVLSVVFGARQSFGLFAHAFATARQVPLSTYALAIALQNLLWGVAQPFAGALSDKRGPMTVIAAGALSFTAGLLVAANATTSWEVILGLGVLIGLGLAGTTQGVVMTALGRLAPADKRATVMGLAAAFGSVGMIVMVPLAESQLAANGIAVALTVLAAGVIIAAPAGALLRTPNGVAGPRPDLLAAAREASREPGFILLTLGFFTCGFHLAFMATHLPGYLAMCGVKPGVAGTALAIVGLFNAIGSLAIGYLGDKFAPHRVLGWLYTARAAVIALFFFAPKSEYGTYAFAAAMGLLWLSTIPPTNNVIVRFFGLANLGGLFGVAFFSHQIGSFLGAWAGGLAVDFTGSYDPVWIASIAMGLVAAMLNFAIALPSSGVERRSRLSYESA